MPRDSFYAPVCELDHMNLIYFDIRAHDEEDIATWTTERKTRFLLNVNSPPPYSLDSWVWSRFIPDKLFTKFECDSNMGLMFFIDPTSKKTQSCQNPSLTHFYGNKISLHEMYALLSEALVELRNEGDEEFHVIAYSANSRYLLNLFSVTTLLGFDVVDSGSFSAIVNCDYSEEKQQVAEEYAHLLNSHHLFNSESDANRFREMSDLRVAGHAPFLVYAIHDISSLLNKPHPAE